MREARFKLAINSPMHQRATPLAACGGRVGYPSLFNAARAIGVNQSTLSARENVKMTYRERRPFIMRTPMESTSNGCFRVDFHGALGSRPRLDSARSLVCTMSRALPHFRGLQRVDPVPPKGDRKGANAPLRPSRVATLCPNTPRWLSTGGWRMLNRVATRVENGRILLPERDTQLQCYNRG
jgi:hypothetical protein